MYPRTVVLGALCGLMACGKTEPRPSPAPSAPAAPSIVASSAPAIVPSAKPPAAEPESVAIQHVLVAYRGARGAPRTVKRTKVDAKKLAEQVLAEARAGKDFSELAARYSDDPGSRDNRGNLGKRRRADLVKPFADAAFRLEEGEVSDVVETEFGFHVIKRNQ